MGVEFIAMPGTVNVGPSVDLPGYPNWSAPAVRRQLVGDDDPGLDDLVRCRPPPLTEVPGGLPAPKVAVMLTTLRPLALQDRFR